MNPAIVDEITKLQIIIDSRIARINTCIPGVITAFDATTQRASVQPAVQCRNLQLLDMSVSYVDMPVLNNVPVLFPYTTVKGFSITLPVSVGDSCLILFAQSAITNHLASGGVQPPEPGFDGRHHDLQDALIIPCGGSVPTQVAGYDSDGIAIRNQDGSIKLKVSGTGVEVTGPLSSTTGYTGVFNTSDGQTLTVVGGVIVGG